MRSSADRFWIAAGRWEKSNPKSHIGVEYSSPLEFFAFKGVVSEVLLGESITFENLQTGEKRRLELGEAYIRLVERSDDLTQCRDLSMADFVCIFRIMWGEDTETECLLTELRDLGKPS